MAFTPVLRLGAYGTSSSRSEKALRGAVRRYLAGASSQGLSDKQIPVLITDLNHSSLLQLAGVTLANPDKLRTVGLKGALDRLRHLVPPVDPKTMEELTALRDGTVHAAENQETEARIVAGYVKYADALVAYLRRDRDDFWGDRLGVADALLADAKSDPLARHKR